MKELSPSRNMPLERDLTTALREAGRYKEAETVARKALALDGNHAKSAQRLKRARKGMA